MRDSLPWNMINDFILDCGKIRDPIEFCKKILNNIDGLISFDQARLYFLDDNASVYDECLLGVDKKVSMEYHDYYSHVDNGAYSMVKRAQAFRNHYPKIEDCISDWSKYRLNEKFFQEYVRPHQIRHVFGLALRDTHNTMKCLFLLERVCDIKFSEKEIATMDYIRSHLDNLYQNFFVVLPEVSYMNNKIYNDLPLTSREIEIAELLKLGVLPVHISEKLYISAATVKKHIANIHEKLNVSTRQELILKLLSH